MGWTIATYIYTVTISGLLFLYMSTVLVLPGSQLVRLPNQESQEDGAAVAFDGKSMWFMLSVLNK